MRNLGTLVLAGCLLPAVGSLALAQTLTVAAPPLTLERAIERFLRHNVAVEAARHRVDVARAERIAARLRPNPTVTVSAENVKLSGPTPTGDLYEVTTSLSHPIELGGKRQLRREVADLGVTLAEAQLADALRQRLGEVKRSFYETLLARTTVEYATETRDGFGELVTLNQTRLEEGAIAEGELLKVRLEHVKSDAAVRQAELAMRQTGIRLLDLLGERDFSTAGSVAGPLDRPTATLDLGTLRETALRERPSLRAASHAVALAERRVALERARATVDIEPFMGYRRAGENNTLVFGIAIPFPIYDRNQAGIARAVAEQQLAVTDLALQRNRALAELESAWQAWQAARGQMGSFEAGVRQAEEVRAVALAAYQEGAIGLLEYLEAQRTLSDVRQRYAQSVFDAHASLLLLEQAAGTDLVP
jgi:cobalt-zinc-cadmium efflux system outer membrane protein